MSSKQTKFEVGQTVTIPQSTPGHDRHKPNEKFRIVKVFPGEINSYQLKGSPSIWPETRLK